MLSFQRLDVYQRAIELTLASLARTCGSRFAWSACGAGEFLTLAIELVEALPRGHADRGDQLIRAAESVVRNIAEAAGRWSAGDASKHYRIARGEAMESAASLDVFKLRKLVAPETYARGIALLEGVVAMLTKML